MNSETKNEDWIKNELIPNLVTNCKLSFDPSTLVSVVVKKISFDESLMLTNCYRVQATLRPVEKQGDQVESVVSLVVKVRI